MHEVHLPDVWEIRRLRSARPVPHKLARVVVPVDTVIHHQRDLPARDLPHARRRLGVHRHDRRYAHHSPPQRHRGFSPLASDTPIRPADSSSAPASVTANTTASLDTHTAMMIAPRYSAIDPTKTAQPSADADVHPHPYFFVLNHIRRDPSCTKEAYRPGWRLGTKLQLRPSSVQNERHRATARTPGHDETSSVPNFNHRLNLERNVERQRRYPHSQPRVLPGLPEYLDKQVRRPVRDLRVLDEVR